MGSIDFGTRHTKQIAGTTKSIENSNLIIIIGAIPLVIGLFILGYTYKKYHNWDEVQASYKEYNCKDEIKTENGKRKNKVYCDLQVSYEYNGQSYTHTETHVPRNSLRPSTRSVDPDNPEKSEQTRTLYLFGGAFTCIGIIALAAGIAKKFRS